MFSRAAVPALAPIASYSTARAAAIRSTSARSAARLVSCASHTLDVPPASSTCTATHSSRSRVRASAGNATNPSPNCTTPSRFKVRQTAIRGVDGSRGTR